MQTSHPSNSVPRWSSGDVNGLQCVTLRLERPSVVLSILFDKGDKNHPCNLKEFTVCRLACMRLRHAPVRFGQYIRTWLEQVLGGLSESRMIELLRAGLRCDTEPESFELKHTLNGTLIPVHYVKIGSCLCSIGHGGAPYCSPASRLTDVAAAVMRSSAGCVGSLCQCQYPASAAAGNFRPEHRAQRTCHHRGGSVPPVYSARRRGCVHSAARGLHLTDRRSSVASARRRACVLSFCADGK